MRAFLVGCCLLVSFACLAQSSIEAAGISRPVKDSTRVITLRCRSTLSQDNKPLFVLNGEVLAEKDFNSIDANDLEQITILKDASATAIYGSAAINGVVLMTTKKWTPGRFVIRDRVSAEILPGATILLQNNSNTVMATADDSGKMVTEKLEVGRTYNLKVTMTGYKQLDSVARHQSFTQTIFLERDVKECAEAVVVAYSTIRCRSITCICQTTSNCKRTAVRDSTSYNSSDKPSLLRVYPNPARKGEPVTVVLKGPGDDPVQVQIISLSGQLLSQQRVTKNNDRLTVPTDGRWSAGTYVIQVVGKASQYATRLIIQ